MADSPDKRTHGQRRREEAWEAMRERIRGMQLINRIEADLDREIDKDELQAVKFKTETRLKLLNKVLPDLAAVRHEGAGDAGEQVVVFKWQPPQN